MIEAGGFHHGADRCRDVVEDMQRPPIELRSLLDRLRREFRRRDVEEDVGSRRLQADHLRIHGGLGGVVGLFGDDFHLVADAVLEAFEIVLSVIVVLIKDRDLSGRIVLEQVFGVDARLALVAGLPAHGPWKVLRIVPLVGAGGDEELRDLLCVHVVLDRGVARRAQAVENQQHTVILDELARLLDGPGRAVAVVVGDEIDLAAVDAALGVDHLEIGSLGLADHAIGGGGSAVRHDVADLDATAVRSAVPLRSRHRGTGER